MALLFKLGSFCLANLQKKPWLKNILSLVLNPGKKNLFGT